MEISLRFNSDVVLSDGSLVRVTPATANDRASLLEFLKGLSPEALGRRFSGAVSDHESLLQWLLPSEKVFTLLGWHEGKIVAQASYHTASKEVAEAGVLVSEAMMGKGLGTILLGQLSEAASEAGISIMEYLISPDNLRVVSVVRDLGFPLTHRYEPGLMRITHPTSFSPDVLARFEAREAVANAAAVRGFLRPRSIAVVGASRQRGTIGGELFHNCLSGGFPGPVYPVNATTGVVQSVLAYRTVLDCPGPVDLAIVAVPSPAVLAVVEQCAQKGVRSVLVISAGFAESGAQGKDLQRQLVDTCRKHGMRLIGPNCMGLANTHPEVSLNAQFSANVPSRGAIGILSQSGAVGLALIDYSNSRGHGMSSFVSVGNKADISGNDLLTYWETDPDTKIILLYLESFGNPRKFARIARRVSRKKPIVVVKGGRSSAGFRATQSHTGALLATSNVTVEALFRECGVIRTDTLGDMFSVTALLDCQPLPKGRNVGIITNAGGAGILATDACESTGLRVPETSKETQGALRRFLHVDSSVGNPVDMVASATAENYYQSIKTMAAEPGVDALIVIFIPPLNLTVAEVGASIVRAARDVGGKLPIVAVLVSSKDVPPVLSDGEVKVPTFQFPEAAVAALSKTVEYAEWLRKPEGTVPTFNDSQKAKAAALVGASISAGTGWLPPDKVNELLGYCGIPTVSTRLCPTPEAAGQAAEEIGGPVVLKGVAPGLLHKRDAGAVTLDLQGKEEVVRAARALSNRLDTAEIRLSGYLVQPMITQAVEMLVGVTHDPTFGPVVACGAGGTLVELVKDVSVHLAPLSDFDAGEMVSSLKTYPLLTGYRGGPKHDVAALQQLLLRVGRMAADLQGIVELDLNPVMVLPEGRGYAVVDARIRVAPPESEIPVGAKKR